jgi:hypothetical protein
MKKLRVDKIQRVLTAMQLNIFCLSVYYINTKITIQKKNNNFTSCFVWV